MKVCVVNKSNHRLPEYSTPMSAGVDLKANISEPITLGPLQRTLIPTDLYMAIPEGYVLQICSRSGLALKNGIFCLNAPGVVDADYRGNVGVILANFSDTPFIINPGDRVAQAVLNKFEKIEWKEVPTLNETERGTGGFGHSGI